MADRRYRLIVEIVLSDNLELGVDDMLLTCSGRAAAARDGGGAAREIQTAQQLLEKGTISEAEFDTIKAKALAAH